ncbi:hypothetical protein Gotur_006034, partial [Gossypium turneri]
GFFWHNLFRYTNWCLGGVLKESSIELRLTWASLDERTT